MSDIIEKYFKNDNDNLIQKIPKKYRKILFYYCKKLYSIYFKSTNYDYNKLFKLITLLEPFDIKEINPINETILTELQFSCIKCIHYMETMLIALPTGSGKTIIAMCAAIEYIRNNPDGEVMVISPTSVVNNFEKEANKFGITFKDNNNIRFYSYDMFMNINKKIKNVNCNKKFIIIDEVHTLRGRGTKYHYIMKCVLNCDKLLLLTATPIVNYVEDILCIINLLNKGYLTGTIQKERSKKLSHVNEFLSEYDFKFEYRVSYSRDPYIKIMQQLRELEKIKFLLKNHMIYKSKTSTYDENFPKYSSTKVYIQMDEKYYKFFEEAVDDSSTLFHKPWMFYHGYRRAVNKIKDYYYSVKMNNILDKLKEGQSIIYSNWLEFGSDIMEQILSENNIKYGLIKGDTPIKTRNKLVKDYNEKIINVIIITKAGSEGLDFKNTQNLIVIDPTWGFSQTQQVIGRAVRYKSHISLPKEKRYVNIYYLILIEPFLDTNEIDHLMTNNDETKSGDLILYYIASHKEDLIKKCNEVFTEISNNTLLLIDSTTPSIE